MNNKYGNGDIFNKSINEVHYSNYLADNNNTTIWNSAIDTMMEVIELHPLIDLSTRDRIASIAKELRK